MRLSTQCRLRSLLTATAGVAVVFGLGVRSARFGGLAEYHQGQEQSCSLVALLANHCGTGDSTADLLTVVEKPGGGLEVRAVSTEAERLLEELGRRQPDRKRAYITQGVCDAWSTAARPTIPPLGTERPIPVPKS
jgi:hypothetical protein